MGTANKKNRAEIALMNVLFCLLVIFIHVSSNPITNGDRKSWQYFFVFAPWKLAAFVVQGFIFLSGVKLFLNPKPHLNYKKFYLGRIKRVVLPYLLWVVIYYLYFCSRNYFPFSVSDLFGYILRGDLVSHFYFVIVIVQFYALMPFWRWLFSKTSPAVLLPASLVLMLLFQKWLPQMLETLFLGVSFPYNDRLFTTYLFYWVAGCYVGLYYEAFTTMLKERLGSISVIFGISLILNLLFSYLSVRRAQPMPWLEHLHVFYTISAILFVFALALKPAGKRIANIALVRGINRASYNIYLSHCLFIFAVDEWMLERGIHGLFVTYLIRIATVYIGSVLCCMLYDGFKFTCKRIFAAKGDRHV